MKKNNDIKLYRCLAPLSYLYGIGVWLRNSFFNLGILKSKSFPLPIICVGNITVGGTGKTPHTEYLIRLLHSKFKVAVLSRGYKRKSKGFVLSTPQTHIKEIGDEPYQMAHKFPGTYIAVDQNRCHGIECLIENSATSDTDVIILDDAFQHRYVHPGLNILLIDYNRPISKDLLLPAGRLREQISGKERADIIIISKCPTKLASGEQKRLQAEVSPQLGQQLFFTTLTYGNLQPLFLKLPERSLDSLQASEQVLLVTGIASPAQIIKMLSDHGITVHPLTFSDHHEFNATDLELIHQAFIKYSDSRRCIIITTEKDATRLINHPLLNEDLKPYIYVLPVEIKFLNQSEQLFNSKIIEYVRKNSRNSSLSEG